MTMIVWQLLLTYRYLFVIGKGDLARIAQEDGVGMEVEDLESMDSVDEAFEPLAVAEKFIRVLSHEEEEVFAVMIEVGVEDRNCQLQIVNERTEVELSYRVPA